MSEARMKTCFACVGGMRRRLFHVEAARDTGARALGLPMGEGGVSGNPERRCASGLSLSFCGLCCVLCSRSVRAAVDRDANGQGREIGWLLRVAGVDPRTAATGGRMGGGAVRRQQALMSCPSRGGVARDAEGIRIGRLGFTGLGWVGLGLECDRTTGRDGTAARG